MSKASEEWKKHLLKTEKVFTVMPEGWKRISGATAAPRGYCWINNGKSLFGGQYEHALLKIA